MVADNIRAGDRSYRNLTKIPDLPTSGFDAIEELHQRSLVKASFREDRVEPTDAFWPWLEELQLAEAQQAAAQQTNAASPGRQPLANTDPGHLPILPSASPEGIVGLPHAPAPALVKPRRPRIERPDLDRVDQMCVKIVDLMNHKGHRLPLSIIRRGVNAYRYPPWLIDMALRRLQRALKIEKAPGTRRQWATLLEVPQKYEATRLPPKRRRDAPRSRGRSPWFQALMAEQELED